MMLQSDSTKQSSPPDGAEVVFTKDNVAIRPTQSASERITGRLELTKQSSSLFMTLIPHKWHSSAEARLSDYERNIYTMRALPFADITSIRRHTPALGLQYIVIVLSSGELLFVNTDWLFLHYISIVEESKNSLLAACSSCEVVRGMCHIDDILISAMFIERMENHQHAHFLRISEEDVNVYLVNDDIQNKLQVWAL
ncbi:hypothetical protein V8G54_015957 [Vigna mungo]|uniref:Small G protein signalling modulator 1/2 Rab-binding domain-containing protein n=1 Tax=Vigna mungo TaxID=3915 RepID=A0AAQ3NLC5_VIGMU